MRVHTRVLLLYGMAITSVVSRFTSLHPRPLYICISSSCERAHPHAALRITLRFFTKRNQTTRTLISDPYGDHQVGCGGNGDRIHRHDSIRDALFSAAQSAALAPRKEVPALIPGNCSRPADIYLPNWRRGQPAALDVTVISALQQLTVEGAADTQGHALTVGRERKLAAHSLHRLPVSRS